MSDEHLGEPIAWIATAPSGSVLHMSRHDGWTVDAVLFTGVPKVSDRAELIARLRMLHKCTGDTGLHEAAAAALSTPREPVAWMYWNEPDTQRHFSLVRGAIGSYWTHVVPLYAAPQIPPTPDREK